MTSTPATDSKPNAATCDDARVRRRRWFTVLTAMAVATALGGLLDPVLGIDLVVGPEGSERRVGNLAITLIALGVGLAGWALLELLEARVTRPRRVWTVVAVVVLVVSLLGPLGARTADAGAALALLHLVVGGILIRGLRSTA